MKHASIDEEAKIKLLSCSLIHHIVFFVRLSLHLVGQQTVQKLPQARDLLLRLRLSSLAHNNYRLRPRLPGESALGARASAVVVMPRMLAATAATPASHVNEAVAAAVDVAGAANAASGGPAPIAGRGASQAGKGYSSLVHFYFSKAHIHLLAMGIHHGWKRH